MKQEVVGWVYPCQDLIVEEESLLYIEDTQLKRWNLSSIYSDKKASELDCEHLGCSCGKECKPIKVKITVEEV